MTPGQKKAVNWLINGETGLSSIALCAAYLGIDPEEKNHPLDPSDFNRCLQFLEEVPEAKAHLHNAANLSPAWRKIWERWAEVEITFLTEAGLGWSKALTAPKTYALMQEIYGND